MRTTRRLLVGFGASCVCVCVCVCVLEDGNVEMFTGAGSMEKGVIINLYEVLNLKFRQTRRRYLNNLRERIIVKDNKFI